MGQFSGFESPPMVSLSVVRQPVRQALACVLIITSSPFPGYVQAQSESGQHPPGASNAPPTGSMIVNPHDS
ncbi:hypothetical protein G4Y73_13730 [Wenzhouxiangella sp. XN201]|uniref:hypothetical protein n=1 Tax=Wenzhouxiangella sp. XN201 TaxID=2710755 RepID=UPI0013CD7F34|nr:hypothetical protein [Wenzhouxiangella sp. XN201]NEZ05211.1 hypothetical protein [Wenzhouxiangella sp. XN201]